MMKNIISNTTVASPTRLWTFQRTELAAQLTETGVLVPDFEAGPIAGSSRGAYRHILHEYNARSGTSATGLIFGIVSSKSHPIIRTADELYDAIEDADAPGGASFPPETHRLLEVEVPEDIFVMDIDFYRFSDLMFFLEDGTPEEIAVAKRDLFLPNNADGSWELCVGHIPHLEVKWVKSIVIPRKTTF